MASEMSGGRGSERIRHDSANDGEKPAISLVAYVEMLDERVDELYERVAGRRKTRRERISEWSGFVGGFLSIAIALFTLYDQSVGKREADQKSISNQLVELTSRIQGFNQQMQAVAYGSQDAVTKQSQITALGAQKTPLVEQGVDLVGKLETPAPGSTYLVLAVELANMGNGAEARRMADLAVGAPGSDFMHSETLRMRGVMRVNMEGPAALPAARQDFTAALQALQRYPEGGRAVPTTTIYGSWIGAEAAGGNCAPIDNLLRRFVTTINSPYVIKTQREMSFGTLRFMLETQNNCAYDSSLIPAAAVGSTGAVPGPTLPVLPR